MCTSLRCAEGQMFKSVDLWPMLCWPLWSQHMIQPIKADNCSKEQKTNLITWVTEFPSLSNNKLQIQQIWLTVNTALTSTKKVHRFLSVTLSMNGFLRLLHDWLASNSVSIKSMAYTYPTLNGKKKKKKTQYKASIEKSLQACCYSLSSCWVSTKADYGGLPGPNLDSANLKLALSWFLNALHHIPKLLDHVPQSPNHLWQSANASDNRCTLILSPWR